MTPEEATRQMESLLKDIPSPNHVYCIAHLVKRAPRLIRAMDPTGPLFALPPREPLSQKWNWPGVEYQVGHHGKGRLIDSLFVSFGYSDKQRTSPVSSLNLSLVGLEPNDPTINLSLTRKAALNLCRRLGVAFDFEVIDPHE